MSDWTCSESPEATVGYATVHISLVDENGYSTSVRSVALHSPRVPSTTTGATECKADRGPHTCEETAW